MHAAELVNQFLLYAVLWFTLIPVTYILSIKKKSSLADNAAFILGSIAISFLLIIFSYTLLASSGVITLLATISSVLANVLIIILIMMAPVLVIFGHYKLENYNRGNGEGSS